MTVDILKLVQILLSHILQYVSTKMNTVMKKRYQLSYEAVIINHQDTTLFKMF